MNLSRLLCQSLLLALSFTLGGCDSKLGIPDTDPDCKTSQINLTYDLNVVCDGGATYEGKVQFKGELLETFGNDVALPGVNVSGNLEPFTSRMLGNCKGTDELTGVGTVEVSFHAQSVKNTLEITTNTEATKYTCVIRLDEQSNSDTCSAQPGGSGPCKATLQPAPQSL